MSKQATIAVLVFCIFCGGQAVEWLHLTANNFVRQVCIDGASQTLKRNVRNVRQMSKFQLPETWDKVTIRAQNRKGKDGILAYVEDVQPEETDPDPVTGLWWQCKSMKSVKNCCAWSGNRGSLRTRQVFMPYTSLVPKKYPRYWVWGAARVKHMCCRMSKCPQYCRNCRKSGPNKCSVCSDGTWLNPASQLCERCASPLCAVCHKNGPDKCDKCVAKTYLDPQLLFCERICHIEVNLESTTITSWDILTPQIKHTGSTVHAFDPSSVLFFGTNVMCRLFLNYYYTQTDYTKVQADAEVENLAIYNLKYDGVFITPGSPPRTRLYHFTGQNPIQPLADGNYKKLSYDIAYVAKNVNENPAKSNLYSIQAVEF